MGATSFKSAISAFAFAKFVLGMEGAEVIYLSGRVTGLAAKLFLTKAKLRQRNPLRVRDVKLLERICVGLEGKSKPDRVASGFFLFLVMARARYSDGQNVVSLTINGNFLEARTARSKTSFTLERRTRFLPMAASIEGIGCDWVKEWLDLLSDTGLSLTLITPPCLARARRERGSKFLCLVTKLALGCGVFSGKVLTMHTLITSGPTAANAHSSLGQVRGG